MTPGSCAASSCSHVTPPDSSITSRSPVALDGQPGCPRRRWSGPRKNRRSRETPSSSTSAHSVPTDGRASPFSIWDRRLGDTSMSCARLRSERPRSSRACRSRAPISRVSASSASTSALGHDRMVRGERHGSALVQAAALSVRHQGLEPLWVDVRDTAAVVIAALDRPGRRYLVPGETVSRPHTELRAAYLRQRGSNSHTWLGRTRGRRPVAQALALVRHRAARGTCR